MANDSLAQGAPKASYLMPRVTKEKWDSLWQSDPVVDRNESKSQSNVSESAPKPEESDSSRP